ncbi:prolipoprotein diacylglyceryl transferase [Candidatus Falkowbacteria bacterium]|nr:prolipoprotein diacylglyceryl transferase [Candidatus Falkowbacteria bacterium]
MFNFLHTFNPSPILATIGPINLYWYGFFILLATLAALTVCLYLAKLYNIKTDIIIDLAFWLIISGLIGARLYAVLLELPYFLANPLDIFKIWQGGLAIHGAIIGGLIALWLFNKKYQQNFWQLAAIVATTLPLAQAIGRWGNYFNQELFGYPTNLPWGIPIDQFHRPLAYFDAQYFHPAFLYESLGNLAIFLILISLQTRLIKKQRLFQPNYQLCVISYAFLYSLLRFSTEFIRIDATQIAFGLRFPQLISLLIILFCLGFFAHKIWRKIRKKITIE